MLSYLPSFHPLLLLIPFLAWYLYSRLQWMRFEQRKDIPQAPSNLLLGHLKYIGEFMKDVKAFGAGGQNHPDYGFDLAQKQLGSPGLMRVDFRPVNYDTLVITSHTIAEQISRPTKTFKYSVNKSPTIQQFNDLMGKMSIFASKGEQWKALRKRFNPGFAPQHLITLLPQIVDKTKIFLSRLDKFAQSGEIFELDQLATGLTFDIIGSVILDIDFNAQDPDEAVQNPIVKEFKRLLPYYAGEEIYQMFMPTYPFRLFRRKRQARRLDKAIQAVISEKFQDSQRQDQEINKLGMKSVLALSMQNIDVLSPTLLQETSDQIKSFLFAGHDTTSILMQWAIYQLLLHPQALATLRAELDTVLGQDADTPTSILERGESALRKLNYTSAIIKETLRLFPPAGSARLAVEGEGLDLRLDDGRIINADGMVLYLCHYAIQRDEKVYGPDAAEWQPERWVGNVETSMEATNDNLKKDKDLGGIPPSAWRPFERGPRNCIGQELANLEARVILACVARRYRFEKVGMGAVVDGTVVGEPLRNRWQITARPYDYMRMKIHMS